MSKKITNLEFESYINKINKNIILLSPYINAKTKIKFKCNVHNQEFESLPNCIKSYKFCCPKGAVEQNGKLKRKNNDCFIEEVKTNIKDITVLEEYKTAQEKISVKCNKCGNVWKITPHNLLSNKGCPSCRIEKSKKSWNLTNEQFLTKINNIHFGNITPLEDYINNRTKIKFRCNIDYNEWYATPNSILNGTGCPKCKDSKLQRKVDDFLDRLGIKYNREFGCTIVPKNPKNGNLMPFDVEICDKKLIFEIMGEQHYRICKLHNLQAKRNKTSPKFEFKKQILYDKYKKYIASLNGYRVIDIPYYLNDKKESYKDFILKYIK